VLRGIKHSLGDSGSTRHLVCDITLIIIIFNSLDIDIPDHCMFWAACNLAYFGFLRSSEFTIPNLASFSKDVHLSLADISIDSRDSPTCLHIRLKASKPDPFWQVALFTLAEAISRCVLLVR